MDVNTILNSIISDIGNLIVLVIQLVLAFVSSSATTAAGS